MEMWKMRSAILALIFIVNTINWPICSKSYAQGAAEPKILFLGNKNIAPVVYQDSNGEPAGIAVDIVRALAKYMPRPFEIQATDWTEAQTLVARGEADVLIQINPTEERKKVYDFSDTLLESQFSIFTTADRTGIFGLSSLRGLRVGVEAGGLPMQVLEKNPDIKKVIIANFVEGFNLLNEGAIDAVAVDYQVGAYVLAQNNIRNIQVSGEPIAFSYSAMAVKKGNGELLNQINYALKKIREDGTYQDTINKWKPKEGVFQTREQIRQKIYHAIIIALAILCLIAVIWMATLKKELTRRKAAEEQLKLSEEKFSDIFHLSPEAIFIIRPDGVFMEVNEGFSQLHGFPKEEVLGKSSLEMAFWGDIQDWKHIQAEVKRCGGMSNQEISFRGKDGGILHGLLSTRRIVVNGKEGILFFNRDITERKFTAKLQNAVYRISEAATATSSVEELCGVVHQIISDLICVEYFYIALYDDRGQGLYCPCCVGGKNGADVGSLSDRNLAGYVLKRGEALLADAGLLAELAARGDAVVPSPLPSGWLGAPLTVADGRTLGMMAVAAYSEGVRYTEKHRDIFAFLSSQVSLAIERKQVAEKLKFVSLHDGLTGVYNRAYFEEKLSQIEDGGDQLTALFICDIDGMKLINDTMGHASGDQLLKDTSRIIQSVAGEDGVVARIGGDEFAIVLTDTSEPAVKAVYNSILEKIDEHNRETGGVAISFSMGYAVQGPKTASVKELFQEADAYMYRQKLHHQQSARSDMVQTLMKMIKERDFITERHAARMQDLVTKLAQELETPEKIMVDIQLLGKFHDIGKVGIPDHILLKPGPLTPEETKEMQRHTEIGFRIAQTSADLSPIAEWILKHHEWWNGQGYPLGLQGEEIPLACRIVAIVDAYDAMTNDRPYRKAMGAEAAKAELRRCAGRQFDPDLVEKFISITQ